MNATARTLLIVAAAIAAACWAVPAFLVGAVPPDAGMFAMMALLYALLPITAVALGMLAAGSARTLFWLPAALGAAFALLFPLAVEDSQDIAFYGIAYAAIGYAAMALRASMAKRCRPPRWTRCP